MWGDGTKEDVIWQVAQQITDLDAVALAYRNLYSDELIKDLQGELSTNDFTAFLQAVASGQANHNVDDGRLPSRGAYSAPQKLIVAIQAVYVRTSPDASYHGRFYEIGENKNIFKTAQPGEFVGYATGKQHYDSKNGVRFIEVAYKKDGMRLSGSFSVIRPTRPRTSVVMRLMPSSVAPAWRRSEDRCGRTSGRWVR